MEIFRLEKEIENEKLDLEMAIVQLKEAKEHLSQSLKRRKELARQTNDHLYVEEKIEDLLPSSSSDEADKAIKELLEKNGSLQEEVRKLRREQEIQSIRLCEILEQRDKAVEDLEVRNNQSSQLENLVGQLSNANEEIMNLRSNIESLRNDLFTERQINASLQSDLRSERKINESLENELISEKKVDERMMKSQADMDQLNQQSE